MAIVTPDVFTSIHQEEVDANSSSNEELIKKIIRNNNFLSDLQPLGSIIHVNVNQAGAPPIDSGVWQLCNGSEITHPSSPLRSIGVDLRFTPNILNQHVRCAPLITGNNVGGSTTINMPHNHGGATGAKNNAVFPVLDDDKDPVKPKADPTHTHGIESSLDAVAVDYPKWYNVAAYMRIQ